MLLDIMREQCRLARVHLIVVNDKVDHTLLEKVGEGIEIHLIRRRPGSWNPVSLLILNAIILLYKFDAIHCHNETLIKAIFVNRGKVSLTIHDVGLSVRELQSYRKLFAISEAVQRDVSERSGLSPQVIYNGIECRRIRPRQYVPLNSGEVFRLVQVSRLQHEKKGQHVVLEALSILNRSHGIKHVQIDFIGEGTSLAYLSALTRDLGLSDQVRFVGLMERDEIFNKLSRYHALVQPSLYEGFGNTVLEGMAARIPVLVSGIQGPMEIIGSGRYGLYFKEGDPRDCAEKIRTLIAQYDSAPVREMVDRAWNRVAQDFDIRVTAKRYCDGYSLGK